jgi:hypothetical protein
MASTAVGVGATLVVTSLCVGRLTAAAELPRVVLHVTDYQQVAKGELLEAQQRATRAYAGIGVQLVWTGGPEEQLSNDSGVHVRVSILNIEMSAKSNDDLRVLGQAGHNSRHVYIYYTRIVDYGFRTQSDPARVLAVVLAHELGHVLLPAYSHTPSGLMQPGLIGRIVTMPPFLPAQVTTIRQMLAAEW